MAEAVRGFDPIPLRLVGLGAFPDPARARVLWVGLTGPGLDALRALREAVRQATATAGYPADDRFEAHVTIGRLKPKRGMIQDLGPLCRHFRTWPGGAFTVAETIVFASVLAPEGSAYSPLTRAPLQGPGAPGKAAPPP